MSRGKPIIIQCGWIKRKFPKSAKIDFLDSPYQVISDYWICRKYNPWYKAALTDWDLFEWREHHDCDNKAFLYWAHAQSAYGRFDDPAAQAMALGVIFYAPDEGDALHAINFAFVGKKKELKYIEPQKPGYVKLSRKERASIYRVII